MCIVHTATAVAQQWRWTTYAGKAGGPGHVDGNGPQARFRLNLDLYGSSSAARDEFGNFYVTDTNNHVIRRISPAGDVTTVAGQPGVPGNQDGTGSGATFSAPTQIAIHPAGDVYVASEGKIRRLTPDGGVTTLDAGSSDPAGFPVFLNGALHAYRRGQNSWLWRYNTASDSFSPVPGFATSNFATDVAPANDGSLVVLQSSTLSRVTAGETFMLAQWQTGYQDGPLSTARFRAPTSVAQDGAVIWVADDHALRQILFGATPTVVTRLGRPGVAGIADGPASVATLGEISDILPVPEGLILVDAGGQTIRFWNRTSEVLTTLAGSPTHAGSTNGPRADSRFYLPLDAVGLADGTVFVTDGRNHGIRKIASDGVVSLLTWFDEVPSGIDVGPTGLLYVASADDGVIKRVTQQGVIEHSFTEENAFDAPFGLDVLSDGRTIVAESGWSATGAISILAAQGGIPSLFAGSREQAGTANGTRDASRFKGPADVISLPNGHFLVADAGNAVLRRIEGNNVVTHAGAIGQPGTADGGLATARFIQPWGLAVDATGVVYVTDAGAHTVRRIGTDGTITTIAGVPGQVGGSDGVGSAALLATPAGISIRPDGRLLVADSNNNRILLGEPATDPSGYWAAAAAAGLSGTSASPLARPHGDAVANLLKYASGLNLAAADSHTLVPTVGTSGLPFVNVTGLPAARVLRIEYVRRIVAGLVYTPEKATTTASGWTDFTSAPIVTAINAQWQRVRHDEPVTGPSWFVRMKVALP